MDDLIANQFEGIGFQNNKLLRDSEFFPKQKKFLNSWDLMAVISCDWFILSQNNFCERIFGGERVNLSTQFFSFSITINLFET